MLSTRRWAITNVIFALLLGIPATLFLVAASKVHHCTNDGFDKHYHDIIVCHDASVRHFAIAGAILVAYVLIVTTVALSTYCAGFWDFRANMYERELEANRKVDRAEAIVKRMQRLMDKRYAVLKTTLVYLNDPKKTAKAKAALKEQIEEEIGCHESAS